MAEVSEGRRRGGLWLVVTAVVAFALGTCVSGGEDESERGAQEESEVAEEVWTCSMHPQIRADGPGQCPICGMDLVPASSLQESDAADAVMLSDRARALAKIVTAPVQQSEASASGRPLVARVEVDETRLRNVTSWIGGRIDRLHLRATGERVRRGQVVATLYSPEVYSAHQDLLVAKRQFMRMEDAAPAARTGAEAALEAARERLRLLGVEGAQLEELEAAEHPTRAVRIRADAGGTILERVATQGSYVRPGAVLYRVADLGRVWVQLEAYERDLPLLRVGAHVAFEFPSLPNRVLEGEVAFVDPVVDPRRRTAQVRVSVRNEDGALRPGMVGEATLHVSGSSQLTIPASAPLFTGHRSLVYVEVSGDRPSYVPRTVTLGPRQGDVYPVLAGLEAGERVVVHGAFVLDADLQIQGGSSMMTRPDDTDRASLREADRAALSSVVEAYLDVAEALAADDAATARQAAERLHQAIMAVGNLEGWDAIAEPLMAHARHVAHAPTLAGMREGFESVSSAIQALLARYGNPTDTPVRLTFCPMAFDGRGARWLQRAEEVHNAYFGEAMLSCGSIEETVAPGDRLEASP